VNVPLQNVKRIYNYPTQTANTLIILTYDANGNGNIHHVVDENTVYGPILTIPGMIDFAFIPYAGRGYISPFYDYANGDLIFQKGLQGQFLYVYAGNGTLARKAAGAGMTGAMTIANGAAGHTDPGLKVFGIVSQTVSGYNSPPALLKSFTTSALSSVSFGTIPTSGDPNVVKRLLVSTITIPSPPGLSSDLSANEFFFVPGAVINNNTDTFLNDISFYDADLLDNASGLFNNLTEIPAGAALALYHNRLCLAATYNDISLIYVSLPGEPEAFDQISGLIVFPLDGNPITNLQELRDVLYVFKRSKTMAFQDNSSVPSSWLGTVIDPGLGTSNHGIATVLDSGGANVDSLLIATFQGISQFNGVFMNPEITNYIDEYWRNLDRNNFRRIQILNHPLQKRFFCVLPTGILMIGDYSNALSTGNIISYKTIRWAPWSLYQGVSTIGIQNIDDIIIGADIF
jgi:hypothetical protein